jgi:uncharacterized membrane protein YheB (UPF0754 family)
VSDLVFLLSMPFITALIGWLTNKVAIVMLFRPRRARRLLGVTLQGAIPRRQKDLARSAAELMEREVLDKHLIRSELQRIDMMPMIHQFSERLVYENLAPRLRKFLLFRGFLADTTLRGIHRAVTDMLEHEAPAMLARLAVEAEHRLDVARLVEERIGGFDLDKLEALVNEVAASELRGIEIMGAVLGFIVGLLQIAILVLAGSVDL